MRMLARLRDGLRSRLRPSERGGVILAYHRIADAPLDPSGLAVSPERFEAQMEWLVRRARPCRLEGMVAGRGASEVLRGAVAVTFDDGYTDNLSMAKPVLERLGIPATVFVPSETIGRNEDFWWDELERVVFGLEALPPRLDVELGGQRVTMAVRDDGGRDDMSGEHRGWRVWKGPARTPRQKLYEALWCALRPLTDAEQRAAIRALGAWAGVPPGPPVHPLLDREGVRELLAGGTVRVGGHTMTHPSLTDIPAEMRRREIVHGRRRLEEITGEDPVTFSYPYGNHDETSVKLVREAGYETAVTTGWGAVTPATDPLLAPRLTVGDWEGDTFETVVRRFLPS